MSNFQWNATGLEERWFQILALLMIRTGKQQLENPSSHVGQLRTSNDKDFDGNDSDTSVSDDEAATIVPRKLAKGQGKQKLIEKFLDRLAETLAHEAPGSKKKSDDVCATALCEHDGSATIYVAKNGSLGTADRNILKQLQVWLQTIAKVGERRDVKKDGMWANLVKWNSSRLIHYRNQLRSSFQAIGIIWSQHDNLEIGKKLALVQTFCEDTSTIDPALATEIWTDCITICYELRYEPILCSYVLKCQELAGTVGSDDAITTLKIQLAFLGRLRSAYETFIEFALQFAFVKTVTIQSVADSIVPLPPQLLSRIDLVTKLNSVGIDITKLGIKEKGKLVKTKARILDIILQGISEPVKVHAEVKLLVLFSDIKFTHKSKLQKKTYIGCSKKSCYMCWHLLQRLGDYTTRGTHGKIYYKWTIPSTTMLTAWHCLRLHAAVSEMGDTMLRSLGTSTKVRQNPVPESTLAITEASSSIKYRKNRRRLDHERSSYSPKPDPDLQAPMFGPIEYTVQALVLPVEGGDPRLISIPIRRVTENYQATDRWSQNVPDFGALWPAALNFDREPPFPFEVTNQESISEDFAVLNGNYFMYYNLNEELGINRFLAETLLEGSPPLERQFWKGDVVILKRGTRITKRISFVPCDSTSEDQEKVSEKTMEVNDDENGVMMYADVPDIVLQASSFILRVFRMIWESRMLEGELERYREADQYLLQSKINKDLILARMTEFERRVLDLMPPGFIEILAIEQADYGAFIHQGIEKDPNNPDQVILKSLQQISTLEQMGWEGFSSDQL